MLAYSKRWKRVLDIWSLYWCPQNDIDRAKKEYGALGYQIFTKVTQLHGFSKAEYATKIEGISDKTRFNSNYRMELTDIWMKIIVKKYRWKEW